MNITDDDVVHIIVPPKEYKSDLPRNYWYRQSSFDICQGVTFGKLENKCHQFSGSIWELASVAPEIATGVLWLDDMIPIIFVMFTCIICIVILSYICPYKRTMWCFIACISVCVPAFWPLTIIAIIMLCALLAMSLFEPKRLTYRFPNEKVAHPEHQIKALFTDNNGAIEIRLILFLVCALVAVWFAMRWLEASEALAVVAILAFAITLLVMRSIHVSYVRQHANAIDIVVPLITAAMVLLVLIGIVLVLYADGTLLAAWIRTNDRLRMVQVAPYSRVEVQNLLFEQQRVEDDGKLRHLTISALRKMMPLKTGWIAWLLGAISDDGRMPGKPEEKAVHPYEGVFMLSWLPVFTDVPRFAFGYIPHFMPSMTMSGYVALFFAVLGLMAFYYGNAIETYVLAQAAQIGDATTANLAPPPDLMRHGTVPWLIYMNGQKRILVPMLVQLLFFFLNVYPDFEGSALAAFVVLAASASAVVVVQQLFVIDWASGSALGFRMRMGTKGVETSFSLPFSEDIRIVFAWICFIIAALSAAIAANSSTALAFPMAWMVLQIMIGGAEGPVTKEKTAAMEASMAVMLTWFQGAPMFVTAIVWATLAVLRWKKSQLHPG